MATQIDLEKNVHDISYFQQALPSYNRAFLKKFKKISTTFVHFHLLFALIFLLVVIGSAIFLSTNWKPTYLAICLSTFFVTSFSYLILLFYIQAKKPDQMIFIKNDFIRSCKALIDIPKGEVQYHLSIAETLSRLSSYLDDFEWEIYKIPGYLQFCSSLIKRFSAYCYWQDVFKMKQSLLLAAIEEHIKQIHITPTDLEVHASLGSTYVILSKLYRSPSQKINHPRFEKIQKIKNHFEEKSNSYCKLAIEEFKILNYYASGDPWVHEQMAAGFKDLGIPDEEIKEVELLVKLRPHDKEMLFRLGTLYFSQGMNAKGLQVFEELKNLNYAKTEDLIASYGSLL